MLLLPLRSVTGEVLGVISVDEPLTGHRPTDDQVRVLMAIADHTAPAIDRVLVAGPGTPSGEAPELWLGLAPARVDRLQAAGVLHDLGELGIADAILHKPGPLTDAEWDEMTRHPEIGARIREHAGLRDIAACVLAHHERLDGRGYPSALAAEEIPLEARILAVAGRLRGDDRRPPVPERNAGGGRARGARALRRHAADPAAATAARRARLAAQAAASITRQSRSTSSGVVRVWPTATRT